MLSQKKTASWKQSLRFRSRSCRILSSINWDTWRVYQECSWLVCSQELSGKRHLQLSVLVSATSWFLFSFDVFFYICILYSIFHTLYSVLYTLYSIFYTLYSIFHILYSILYIPYSILYILYSILYTLYSIFHILYSILYILYSILYTLYSIFYILYSIFSILYSIYSILFYPIYIVSISVSICVSWNTSRCTN